MSSCQWRNRGGGSGVTRGEGKGAECPPSETSGWEISADLPGKKEARKKGGEMRRGPFFSPCFSLKFKTTSKICFGSTKMKIFYRAMRLKEYIFGKFFLQGIQK